MVGDVTNEDDVIRIMAAAVEATGTLDGVVANAGGGGSLAPLGDAGRRRVRAGDATQRHRHLPHRQALVAAPDRVARARSWACRRSPARTRTATSPATPRGRARSSRSCATPPTSTACSGCASTRCARASSATEIMEGISREGSTYESYIVNTPLGRVGDPDEIAHVVRFLLGPESQWMTGQIINVDGGNSLRSGPDYGELVVMMHGPDAIPGFAEPVTLGDAVRDVMMTRPRVIGRTHDRAGEIDCRRQFGVPVRPERVGWRSADAPRGGSRDGVERRGRCDRRASSARGWR